MRLYYLYIMASIHRVLYVGVTGNLEQRVIQHRSPAYPNSFTAMYRVNRLVYFEEYTRPVDAIEREKQIKRWRRSKKVALIRRLNPNWDDLAPPVHQVLDFARDDVGVSAPYVPGAQHRVAVSPAAD